MSPVCLGPEEIFLSIVTRLYMFWCTLPIVSQNRQKSGIGALEILTDSLRTLDTGRLSRVTSMNLFDSTQLQEMSFFFFFLISLTQFSKS